MLFRFLRLEYKQFFRSSYWQKSLALNILMVFLALYFIVMFLGLGFGLYPLLQETFPGSDPLLVLNGFLFYWFIADLMMRFFLQKLPVMNVKPFLTLPLKKSAILHYTLGKTGLSFFNFLPLFTIIPFSVILMIKGHPAATVLVWLLTMVVFTLIINFLNFFIEQKSADTELSFLPIILIVTILFAIDYFQIFSLSGALSSFINAIITDPLLILVPAAILIALYGLNYTALKKKLYLDEALKSKEQLATTQDIGWTRRFGVIAPFLQLDLKMLWRNKRPKSSLWILLMGLLYGLFFYPNPTYQNMVGFYVFIGIFITGIFMINWGQFIPAWDSGYYRLLMSQNIQYKDYLKSKFTLMAISAVIMFVLSIPYVYFGWKILLVHLAAMIYNIGVNTHVLLYGGAFNRKKIDLNKRAAFNYQGTGAVQWLIGFPLLLVPMILFYIPYKLINLEAGLAVLVLLGIAGIVFHQKIMDRIEKKYLAVKYKQISAFGQE